MTTFLRFIKNNPIVRLGSSLTITVVCLAFLIILTFWGTIAQIDNGLFWAQNRFFHSWGFLIFGFIPFPGAQLILWILFCNLLCAALTRFEYRLNKIGITVIHFGLLLYFISAFITFHVTEESNVHFRENTGTNLSASYNQWELSIWPTTNTNTREVIAVDQNEFSKHGALKIPTIPFNISIEQYFANANAYKGKTQGNIINASGIVSLTKKPTDKDPEQNIPGLMLNLVLQDGQKKEILLYGGDSGPTTIQTKPNESYFLNLRRKRYLLPFTITLKDFQMENHPGTTIAKTYKSFAEITHNNVKRDVMIYMNNPFRYKDYTLYQASYGFDQMGREYSTLAVVKNKGRLLPYIASFVTFFGLAWHFLMMGIKPKKRKK